jgi:Raf kinase inhibitor-like YbhB/YbcL family protein
MHEDRQMSDFNSTLRLESGSFTAGGDIPPMFTCEGEDRSPELRWMGAPTGTKSFALIVDDPDAPDPAAPKMVYVHWVLHNIPAATTIIPEDAARTGLPSGVVVGTNDWGKQAWGGPCPPIGRHRYFFKLYALDTELKDLSAPRKDDLLKAMKGHVLAQAELMGTYMKGAANK